MRRFTRDRAKRRNQSKNPQQSEPQPPSQAPLQPTFLDREPDWPEGGKPSLEARAEAPSDKPPEPVYEAQPEKDPFDGESAGQPQARRERSRRRGRGGRGRNRTDQQQKAAQAKAAAPALPIRPGQATGEASEIDAPVAEPGEVEVPEREAEGAQRKPAQAKAPKGAVVLAIGLPGSGKSSWFKRHSVIPLSSDLVRGLLFDDATEQRFQDLVFSSLRSLLRARLIAGRPMNYIDATNLSPKERHSWIKMAQDFGYEAHAFFFDVPTEICMERNRKRLRNVPDDVMLRMAQKLRPPKFDEGFSKVIVVRLKGQSKGAETPPQDDGEEAGEA